jgi:hypothetical protein
MRDGERDDWVEVGVRDGGEGRDRRDEGAARGEGVGQEREGRVAAGEALAHDS